MFYNVQTRHTYLWAGSHTARVRVTVWLRPPQAQHRGSHTRPTAEDSRRTSRSSAHRAPRSALTGRAPPRGEREGARCASGDWASWRGRGEAKKISQSNTGEVGLKGTSWTTIGCSGSRAGLGQRAKTWRGFLRGSAATASDPGHGGCSLWGEFVPFRTFGWRLPGASQPPWPRRGGGLGWAPSETAAPPQLPVSWLRPPTPRLASELHFPACPAVALSSASRCTLGSS